MERIIKHAHAEHIAKVMNEIPFGIQRMLEGVHFIAEVDPVYMGINPHGDTPDGRSYRNTSHVLWEQHQGRPACDRRTTIVLLDGDSFCRDTILHEVGHALDERLGFDRPYMVPLDDYAATNEYEAFATAFQAWMTDRPSSSIYHGKDDLLAVDPDSVVFFDSLALHLIPETSTHSKRR